LEAAQSAHPAVWAHTVHRLPEDLKDHHPEDHQVLAVVVYQGSTAQLAVAHLALSEQVEVQDSKDRLGLGQLNLAYIANLLDQQHLQGAYTQ
tara:strand:- start:1264 stop:1539 length:276 start_codon:yes stop_codon:yes gene_type:complete